MTAKRISLFLTALTAPVLTLLTVLALALLPPRLSALGDGALLGGVHSEELGEDSNFPARPPDLPGRIELLATQQTAPERLTIAEQVLESPEALSEASALARRAVEMLTEAGVLPSGQPEFDWTGHFSAFRFYLRDRADLSSAGFLSVWASDGWDCELIMTLDPETGRVLSFRLAGPAVLMEDVSPEDKGTRFLEHLGDALDYELAGDGEEHRRYAAVFRLGDSQAVYHVVAFSRLLEFRPELEAADVYGGLQAAGK